MSDLDVARKEINEIDEQILELLAKRQSKVMEIARLKSSNGMTAHQAARHEAVIRNRQTSGTQHGLNPAMVNLIWQAIMTEAIRIQEEILSGKTK
jgi:chorismate mutase